jgi:hypothetical protein
MQGNILLNRPKTISPHEQEIICGNKSRFEVFFKTISDFFALTLLKIKNYVNVDGH